MMKSLQDKIKNTPIEYERSDIYYQIIGIVVVLFIIIIAVLLVNINYLNIPVVGSLMGFVENIILKILNLFSSIIRKILDLF